MEMIFGWFRRTLSDPQIVLLGVVLLAALFLLLVAGPMLGPAIASLIVAYLLEGLVGMLERWGLPRLAAVIVVFLLFLGGMLTLFFVLVPLLLAQIAELAQQIPGIFSAGQELLLNFLRSHPELIEEGQVRLAIDRVRGEVLAFGQNLLLYSVTWVPELVTVATYLLLVPMMVFFFLKDKARILGWFLGFLPPDRPLLDRVWAEVSAKVGGYVRGKAYEILIVSVVTYFLFLALDLRFAALLAAVTGVLTLVPYVGAVAASIPVLLVAYYQWGFSEELLWLAGTYGLLHLLDGYVLQPLLLGGLVDLHPIAVVIALLVFGGTWGFWGLFFAIPLASVVQAVLDAWPRAQKA